MKDNRISFCSQRSSRFAPNSKLLHNTISVQESEVKKLSN